jgi:quercetin dioxygenase-like cupin family protein
VHEGWLHYIYNEPGSIFPAWKSSFVKQVTFPSGQVHIVGCGIYNMQLDQAFIEDIVNRAARLVMEKGKNAFSLFRDKKGPFFFMDCYVFVMDPRGTELVNPAQPSLEGRNLLGMKDLTGKEMVREEIEAVMNTGEAWVEMYWYKPGDNRPALKKVFLKKVMFGQETYLIGSGFYPLEGFPKSEIQKWAWKDVASEKLSQELARQVIHGDNGSLVQFQVRQGGGAGRHWHTSEEFLCMLSGSLTFSFDDREIIVKEGELLIIPANEPHSIVANEDSKFVEFFSPVREDWIRGEDQYLRN